MYIKKIVGEPLFLPYEKMKNISLDDYDFHRSLFEDFQIEATTFARCDFRNTKMNHVNIVDTIFRESKLILLEVYNSKFCNVLFTNEDLTHSEFANVEFVNSEFHNVVIKNNKFHKCKFQNCKFHNCTMVIENLIDCEFIEVTMEYAIDD